MFCNIPLTPIVTRYSVLSKHLLPSAYFWTSQRCCIGTFQICFCKCTFPQSIISKWIFWMYIIITCPVFQDLLSFFNIFHLNPVLSTLFHVGHDFFQYFKSHSRLALPPRTLPGFLIIYQWRMFPYSKLPYSALCPVLLDLKSLNSSSLAH